MKTSKPFGMWSSPISASQISQGLQLIDVRWDHDGRTLVWVEGHSGQNHVMSQATGDATRELTTVASVSGGIGYGGGEFALARGTLVYATREGPLFRRSLGQDQSRQITPSFGACASAAISPDGNWVAYIFSDGKTDLLGLVDSQGQEWPLKLAQGADFYMQPAWHPTGDRLAWIEWNHPNMPWDGTRLQIATLAGSPPRIANQIQLAGDDEIPVSQPNFSPDGKFLSYIEAAGEWERLVVVDLVTQQKRILVEEAGFNLAQPAWVQGRRSCAWSWTSQRLFYIRYSAGQAALWQVDLASGRSEQIDCAPYTSISQLSAAPGSDELAFLASAPSVPTRVVRWDGSSLHIVERSDPEDIPAEFFPTARPVTWNSPDGKPVHGIYYPPTNPNDSASGLPPAIVHIHGGPTDQASIEYAPGIAYFTSRGYAWLDVNYRGSTGYGRSYQTALRQHWGDIDVVDAAGGALALAELGLANPRQIVIHGGSAGGYTVLNALIHHPDIFKAGICLYGVSNLFLLDLETHKFEAHYTASLVGELPGAADRYHAWSPGFHAHLIRNPLAVFQGAEDKVVPPDQSEAIVAALRANAVPHLYKLYPGEGHGFRKSTTILDYLQQVERFLQMHVLFAP